MRKICPICWSGDKIVLKTIKMKLPEYFHLPGEYDVVACKNCGFCYASTEASEEDYDYYYSHCNSYSGTPSESAEYRNYVHKIAELIGKFVSHDKCLLDMGFGRGDFMRILRENGFCNVCGIDPSLESVKKMSQEGFMVYLGSVYDEVRDSLQGKFDCVFCFDVLEHLLSPDKAIKQIAGYLKDDGYLLVRVPDYSVLGQDDSKLPNQFNREHINYFSKISLDNLMNRNCFYRVGNKIRTGTEEDNVDVLALYQHGADVIINEIKDEVCQNSIMSYLERNNGLEAEVNEKLARFRKDSAVYIWGVGSYTMWLLANTDIKKFKIEAFIDNNSTKVGETFLGRPIINADKIDKLYPILICCMCFSGNSGEIVKQIEKMCKNQYVIL